MGTDIIGSLAHPILNGVGPQPNFFGRSSEAQLAVTWRLRRSWALHAIARVRPRLLVVSDRFAGTMEYCCGDDSPSAIPWPEGLERNRQERGELALPQTDGST